MYLALIIYLLYKTKCIDIKNCFRKTNNDYYEFSPWKDEINIFLEKNKNKIIKEVIQESCIICLDEFKNNNKNPENKWLIKYNKRK